MTLPRWTPYAVGGALAGLALLVWLLWPDRATEAGALAGASALSTAALARSRRRQVAARVDDLGAQAEAAADRLRPEDRATLDEVPLDELARQERERLGS